jgi:chemotaxis protein CheD
MASVYLVGIGQMCVAHSPARLVCLGLGSCVAIALWDKTSKIGGMAHVMLPNETCAPRRIMANPAGKFGTTAVKALSHEMKEEGANIYTTVAKIAGGANMFKDVGITMKDIGIKNADAVKCSLEEGHIKVVGEDVGGSHGRTVDLDTATGKLHIKTIHGTTKYI